LVEAVASFFSAYAGIICVYKPKFDFLIMAEDRELILANLAQALRAFKTL